MPAAGPAPARPRRWGWHRLESDWADRLVRGAGLHPGELVYDLGAGEGAITAGLLAAGARVIAVERHRRRAATLRDRFGDDLHSGRLRVLEVDLRAFRAPGRPFRVVANPPFDQTSELLRLLTARASGLQRADLVLQRDVARRWSTAAVDAAAGRSRLPPGYLARCGQRLPPSAFRPPPSVPTAVLQIRRR